MMELPRHSGQIEFGVSRYYDREVNRYPKMLIFCLTLAGMNCLDFFPRCDYQVAADVQRGETPRANPSYELSQGRY